MNTTAGALKPFGEKRLGVVELFVALVEDENTEVRKRFKELGIVNTCLDFFFAYQWNNFLHTAVVSLIQGVCKPPVAAEGSQYQYDLFVSV